MISYGRVSLITYLHDGVDSGDLLEHLQEAAQDQGAPHRWRLKDLEEDPRILTSLRPHLKMHNPIKENK